MKEELKHNCSSVFLLRPVVKTKNLRKHYGFINSYLRDKNREDLTGDLLFVLFKPQNTDQFELFLAEQMEGNRDYVEDYDYPEGHIVVVYRIGDKLKIDFEWFKKGKYSRLSELIYNWYDEKGTATQLRTTQWEIIHKSDVLRSRLEEFLNVNMDPSLELWKIPDLEDGEVLDIDKILKLVEQ